jgi:hypothetical protein
VTGPLTAARLALLDPGALTEEGCERLVLAEPVGLGADDEFDVRFLWLLREAVSRSLRVEWTAGGPLPFDDAAVCHIPPPRAERGGGADGDRSGDRWRSRYRFGLCYYRVGPAFVLLRDVRDSGEGARYRLEEPAAVAAWPGLEAPVRLTSADKGVRELAALLEAERLVLRRGEWATLLPFRMRHWPVPFDQV